MLAFPTIRHTGSHFIVSLFDLNIDRGMAWKGQGGDFYFDHIDVGRKHRFMQVLRKSDIVVPLRHPKVVAVSWAKRNKDEQELIGCFDILVNEIDPLKPNYLPIDSDYRNVFLKKLNFNMGLNLTTDWQPKASEHRTYGLRHETVTASPAINDLCERINPFLSRFYEDNNA